MADLEDPSKPESAGEPPVSRSVLKSAALVIAVILLLVAISFVGLGMGYFNALFNRH